MGISPDVSKILEQANAQPKSALGQTDQAQMYQQMANQNAGQSVPQAAMPGPIQAAQIATGPQDQMRGYQSNLAAQLAAQAAGQGPSLAQAQLQAGTDRALQSQMAALGSQRGMNSGLGARLAAQGAGDMQTQLAQQSAQTRLGEQLQAQQGLGALTSNVRGQDIGLASQQAGMQQQANTLGAQLANQTNLANMQGALQSQAQKNAFTQGMYGLGQQRDVAQYGGQIQQQGDLMKMMYGAEDAKNKFWQDLAGKTIGAGAQMGAAAISDERAKKNIKSGDGDIKEFLSAIGAHKYDYKDKDHGEGTYVSPMAQELEKTKLGKSMVKEQDGVKMVDYARGFGAMLAAQSHLNKRLDDMEKRG
jgi:hypothetical protein